MNLREAKENIRIYHFLIKEARELIKFCSGEINRVEELIYNSELKGDEDENL